MDGMVEAIWYRGYNTSGHFIWNLSNEPPASLINSVRNDYSCNIQFII